MTLRQVWVRLMALPPDALIWRALEAEKAEREEAVDRAKDDAALAPFAQLMKG